MKEVYDEIIHMAETFVNAVDNPSTYVKTRYDGRATYLIFKYLTPQMIPVSIKLTFYNYQNIVKIECADLEINEEAMLNLKTLKLIIGDHNVEWSIIKFINEKVLVRPTTKTEEELKDMNKIKLFISQPMTGIDDDEVRRIRNEIVFAVQIMIGTNDFDVINQFDVAENPADFKDLNENQIRQTRLNRSLDYMKHANIIVFARDWWKSPGCIEEYIQCRLYQNGAVIMFGNEIEDVLFNLYDKKPNESYDLDAQDRIIHLVDEILNTTNTPKTLDLVRPRIVLSERLQTSNLPVKQKLFVTDGVSQEYIDSIDEKELEFFDELDNILHGPDDEKDEKDESFRDYVDTCFGDDKKYALLIQETLTNFFIEEIKNVYGEGKSKVTRTNDHINGQYISIKTIAPIDYDIKFEIVTCISDRMQDNEEYHRFCVTIRTIYGQAGHDIYHVDFLPSQISPENDERVTNQLYVGYIGASNIYNKNARKIFVGLNRKFKQWIVQRDDIEFNRISNYS